ncbi:hypothetical protein [Haloarchaeobius sp. DFWS5]|uniref:hypothetical protein n=1 Tax=Haloarchaeobius sp. DFWS5 TaxID=3446114 RepID=UPI003EBFFAB4
MTVSHSGTDAAAVTIVYESDRGNRETRTISVENLDYVDDHWRLSDEDDGVLRIPRERIYSIETPDHWKGSFLKDAPLAGKDSEATPADPTTHRRDVRAEETCSNRPQVYGE